MRLVQPISTNFDTPLTHSLALAVPLRSCREFFTPLGMEFDFVDFRDPENVKKAKVAGAGGRTDKLKFFSLDVLHEALLDPLMT